MKNFMFTHGHLYDVFSGAFRPLSLLVQDGLIAYIGTADQCILTSRQRPEIIDLEGRVLMPAFTDCHTHFVEYAKSRIMVNLDKCKRLSDIIAYLENYRDNTGKGLSWILGGGWDRNKLAEPAQLNKHILDKIFPDKPVALMSKDYHARWCNSLALKLSGMDKVFGDPPGGRIERLPDGSCSGVLFETATETIDKYLDLPPVTSLLDAIHAAVTEIHQFGLTAFHTMESRHSCELLRSAQDRGADFRFCWHFPVEEMEKLAKENKYSYEGDALYKLGGVKLFGDGSLGSRTAAMVQAYSSDKNNTGILRYSDRELFELASRAADHGFACTIHAIGDRCVNQVLNILTSIQIRNSAKKLFHRIEHLQSMQREDLHLLAQSGIFCSLQPLHLANDVPMIKEHWADIETEAYIWKSLYTKGITPGFGSDAPIESINPFLGIYTAITRHPALDNTLPAFHPEEALSLPQAIAGYTINAAKASQSEACSGSLEIGKNADLIVLDDFRNQSPEYWLQARSRLTMLGGRVLYSDISI